MRTDYGELTRKYFGEEAKAKILIDFGMAQMFESATTYTNILLLEKGKPHSLIPMCRIKNDYSLNSPLTAYVKSNTVHIDNPVQKSWISYDKKEYALIKRIEAQGTPLKDWKIQINRGVLTGLNEAFIIDTETRNRLVKEDPKSDEIIKPILRGEDIKAYIPNWNDRWVIGTFPALNLKINQYTAVKKHLSKYRKQLEPKPKGFSGATWEGRKSGAYEWFETQDSISYYQDFSKPKVIYPNMTKFMPFVYDKGSFFCNQKCFIITGERLGYLTAFFNSTLFKFAFKEYFPELLGDTRELSKVFFKTVPVKEVTDAEDKIFTKLVEQIQTLKKNGKPSLNIEAEIENKIADLYRLSEADRGFIYKVNDEPILESIE